MEIPLRRKYRSAYRGRYKGGEGAAPKKNRHKLSADARAKLPEQPKVVMYVDGKTGKSRIVKT